MAYYISGNVTLGIWAKKAGAWVKITDKTVSIFQSVAGAGSYSTSWDVTYDVDMGTGIQAFGVTIEDYYGDGAALTDFVSAIWTTTIATGERSATPSGQYSTVTVRPQ